MDAVSQAPTPRVPRRPRYQPYRTVAVVAVALGLAAVPLLAIVGHRQLAVLWLVVGLLTLALVRVFRPHGTWIAARSRLFDVVFNIVLALALAALVWYVNLPNVL